MKNKLIIILSFFVIFITISIIPCYALELTPSNHGISTSTNANNLVNYARSYHDFLYSDFVYFQSGDYEYYIVWASSFNVRGSSLTASDVQYIRYYRTSTSGMTNSYRYQYGTDDNFELNLNEYVITSNIDVGMYSSVYEQYRSDYHITYLLVICVSLLFANVLTNFRRSM